MKLAGIIFVHDISEARMLGTTLNNMHMFRTLCGDGALKAVILMTTKWGVVDDAAGDKREGQLAREFWKPMLDQGSKICRSRHTPASAQEILDSICDNYQKLETPNTLRIQEEIVDMQKSIPETDAGRKLRYILQELLDMQKSQSGNKDDAQKTLRLLGELQVPFSQRLLGFFGLGVGLPELL
jgi:hypothetical protein